MREICRLSRPPVTAPMVVDNMMEKAARRHDMVTGS